MKDLQLLGLTQNESKVYIALVRLKHASVSDIYRTSDVPRVNIYDVLESLKAKGLVGTVTKSNKRYYEPANPRLLRELLAKRKEELKEIDSQIAHLEKVFIASSTQQDVMMYKGRLGIKSILKDSLTARTEMLNYGSSGKFPSQYPEYHPIWSEKRIQSKIIFRMIAPRSARRKVPKEKYMRLKFIDIDVEHMTSTLIYDDKVAQLIWTEKPFGILIRNEQLANSHRNYFEALWKIGCE